MAAPRAKQEKTVKMRQRTFSKRHQDAFLERLRKGWSVTSSIEATGFARLTVYRYRSNDPAFAAAWDDAYEQGTDVFEDEAKRRAVDGILEPVFFKGEIVGEIQRYSDQLLVKTLQMRRPAKWRERLDVTGADGGPLEIRQMVEGATESLVGKLAQVVDIREAKGK